jgi:hypothetical protein
MSSGYALSGFTDTPALCHVQSLLRTATRLDRVCEAIGRLLRVGVVAF